MSPTCQSGVDLLMEYLEGVLAPDVRAALEHHVARCAKCTAFVASYRETPRMVRDATTSALPANREAALQEFLRRTTDAFKKR